MKDEYFLIVKTALLYYRYDMNQPEIARKLGLSRQKVGRLLKQAKEQGIVKITIDYQPSYSEECAAKLERLYNLKEALVIDVPVYDEEEIKNEIGKAAAAFLRRIMRDNDSLSISWSSMVYLCARHLGQLNLQNITYSQLNGNHEKVPYKHSGMNILNILTQNTRDSTSFPLLAPMKVNSEELLQSLKADDTIKRAMQAARESRIAVFGIGSISKTSILFQAGYMDTDLVNKLQACGAAADVCGHVINSDGELCDLDSERKTLSIEPEELKKKEYRVAIAGHEYKANAIYGALQGNWCNVLVTDLRTAERLIEMKTADTAVSRPHG